MTTSIPKPGERWKHAEGGVYEIVCVTNTKATKPDWDTAVVYKDESGGFWSRGISDFLARFTKLPDPEPSTGEHGFEDVLADIPDNSDENTDNLIIWFGANEETIRRALLIADRVMQEPTRDSWSGLARDIMMGLDLGMAKGVSMRQHLHACGTPIPDWLEEELSRNGGGHHMSKGTRCVLIFKAMRDQLLREVDNDA